MLLSEDRLKRVIREEIEKRNSRNLILEAADEGFDDLIKKLGVDDTDGVDAEEFNQKWDDWIQDNYVAYEGGPGKGDFPSSSDRKVIGNIKKVMDMARVDPAGYSQYQLMIWLMDNRAKGKVKKTGQLTIPANVSGAITNINRDSEGLLELVDVKKVVKSIVDHLDFPMAGNDITTVVKILKLLEGEGVRNTASADEEIEHVITYIIKRYEMEEFDWGGLAGAVGKSMVFLWDEDAQEAADTIKAIVGKYKGKTWLSNPVDKSIGAATGVVQESSIRTAVRNAIKDLKKSVDSNVLHELTVPDSKKKPTQKKKPAEKRREDKSPTPAPTPPAPTGHTTSGGLKFKEYVTSEADAKAFVEWLYGNAPNMPGNFDFKIATWDAPNVWSNKEPEGSKVKQAWLHKSSGKKFSWGDWWVYDKHDTGFTMAGHPNAAVKDEAEGNSVRAAALKKRQTTEAERERRRGRSESEKAAEDAKDAAERLAATAEDPDDTGQLSSSDASNIAYVGAPQGDYRRKKPHDVKGKDIEDGQFQHRVFVEKDYDLPEKESDKKQYEKTSRMLKGLPLGGIFKWGKYITSIEIEVSASMIQVSPAGSDGKPAAKYRWEILSPAQIWNAWRTPSKRQAMYSAPGAPIPKEIVRIKLNTTNITRADGARALGQAFAWVASTGRLNNLNESKNLDDIDLLISEPLNGSRSENN